MREIKFRAWNKEDKIFHYNVQDTYNFGNDNVSPPIFDTCFGDVLEDNGRYVVEQYTGLKDKNGKEVYEGDRIKYKYEVPKIKEGHYVCKNCGDIIKLKIFKNLPITKRYETFETRGVVIWEGVQFMCDWQYGRTLTLKEPQSLDRLVGTLEVIGNIHEDNNDD